MSGHQVLAVGRDHAAKRKTSWAPEKSYQNYVHRLDQISEDPNPHSIGLKLVEQSGSTLFSHPP